MARACAAVRVAGQFGVRVIVVAPPADTAVARGAHIAGDLPHGVGTDEPAVVPIAFAEHEPPDTRGRTGRIVAAAPGADQRQPIDNRGLVIADGPFVVRHADGSHHALPQQGANILVRSIPQRCGDRVRQHRDAGVAVRHLRARREQHGRVVAGNGERVARRREPLPEVAFPAGQFLVGQLVRLGILDPRGVRAKLPDRDAGLLRVIVPLRHELGRRIVQRDPPIAHRHRQRYPADNCLGHRGGAVLALGRLAGRVPLADDLVVAHDQQTRGLPRRQIDPHRFKLFAGHALTLRRGGRPPKLRGAARNGRQDCTQHDQELLQQGSHVTAFSTSACDL
jgi:hypothetical protein